ncbi:dihydrofolate reductase [bacterium]|nr:MAG: dihydrofolate reductase [bacterium]
MKPQVILYIAISRDGFIADENGSVDWLNSFAADLPPDMDCGYHDFFASLDLIVMGRKTYEQMLTFGDWPNAGKHSYIFTESTEQPAQADITFVNESVTDFIKKIAGEKPGCKIWLEGGASLVQQFLDAHLIDESIITIIPITLNEGIALPHDLVVGTGFNEINSIDYSHDIIQKHFVKK